MFGAGRFAPETHEGRRLIAHELTHVVRQLSADQSSVGQGLSPISHVVQHGTATNGQSQEASDASAENQSEPMFSRQAGQCDDDLSLSTGSSRTGDIQKRQPTVTPRPLILARSPIPQTGWVGAEEAAVIRAAIRGRISPLSRTAPIGSSTRSTTPTAPPS